MKFLQRHGWKLILVPLAFLLYANVLNAYFHSDDFELLGAVKTGGPFGIWSGHGQPFFRPLVSLTCWLQLNIWGLNPLPFRSFNILLHAGNAIWVGTIATLLARR